jgi:hypothetical protein
MERPTSKPTTMTYEQLTIHQRIGLKGFIQTEESLSSLRLVWMLWGFKKAVEYFLNEDLNELQPWVKQMSRKTNHCLKPE